MTLRVARRTEIIASLSHTPSLVLDERRSPAIKTIALASTARIAEKDSLGLPDCSLKVAYCSYCGFIISLSAAEKRCTR